MTHDQLVHRAINWMWPRRCSVVISEMTSGGSETPDVIGFNSSWTTVVECKTSRGDFLQDKHKPHYRTDNFMGNWRYYLTFPNIIKPDEIPEDWGLLEIRTKTVRQIKEAIFRHHKDSASEAVLLISAIRRLSALKYIRGIHVRGYTYRGNDRFYKPRATLGILKGPTHEKKRRRRNEQS